MNGRPHPTLPRKQGTAIEHSAQGRVHTTEHPAQIWKRAIEHSADLMRAIEHFAQSRMRAVEHFAQGRMRAIKRPVQEQGQASGHFAHDWRRAIEHPAQDSGRAIEHPTGPSTPYFAHLPRVRGRSAPQAPGGGGGLARIACLLVLLALAPLVHADTREAALLHPLIQDHAVLQRDRPVRLQGEAPAGSVVHLTLADRRAQARADADGHWLAELPALPAGGPHTLTVRAGETTRTVRDLLVGDVWLCAGQSNMELQVWRSLDARAEIAGADAPDIRLLTVPQVSSPVPLARFTEPVTWQPVTPESVRDFSAACYYFARELRKTVDVPMGLIEAAWGGSRVQAWTSGDALRAGGHPDEDLDVLALYHTDPMQAAARWGERWAAWWSQAPGVPADDRPWTDTVSGDWRAAPRDLGAWERWGVPELATFDGMVWYRTSVRLTAAQAAQDATLLLGPADEMDLTWVNGTAVGSSYGAGTPRAYPLPPGLLRAGDNTIVVNVLDTYREGGLAGPESAHRLQLADGAIVPLDAGWRYRIVPPQTGAPPRAPWQSAAGLSTLYNGMIAPLGTAGLRGVVWYQGEANTGEAGAYADQLRGLRDDWRTRFGDPQLPWLVVQLPNYGAPTQAPGESDWATLREAQRRVAGEPHAALGVTIDLGEADDIHPANKQEIGRRLARAARHAVYGDALAPSGPVPRSARREADTVVVTFDAVDGGLVAYGAPGPVGFELCGADAGSCRWAQAVLDGDRVRLQAPDVVVPVRVRYAWADNPLVNLFDRAGQPPGPFEIEIR